MSNNILKNVRTNPTTGELDFYYPLRIAHKSVLDYAKLNGLEIGWATLYNHTFRAVMIPCKRTAHDAQGNQIYLDTPTEEQRLIFTAYAEGERTDLEKKRLDGRCQIPNARGTGVKRCPRRLQNPAYIPGGDEPKTLPNNCEGCSFERFKHSSSTVLLSSLDHEDDEGNKTLYEPPAPRNCFAGDRYEDLAVGFVAFVNERNPKLVPLAEKLVQEYTLTEASKELQKPLTTLSSQKGQLKKLLREFLDNAAIF